MKTVLQKFFHIFNFEKEICKINSLNHKNSAHESF